MLEILAPAGNAECAYAAINNGADAIYLGLASSFSARQGADNFDAEAFRDILRRPSIHPKRLLWGHLYRQFLERLDHTANYNIHDRTLTGTRRSRPSPPVY